MADLHVVADKPSDGPIEFANEPPHHLAAEQAVLGAMLMSPIAVGEAVELVQPEDFYQPRHQILFGAIADMFGRGDPVDLVTVASYLLDTNRLASVGGGPYLQTLCERTPTVANVVYYAKRVAAKAFLRRIRRVGDQIMQFVDGANSSGLLTPQEVYAKADQWLSEAAARITTQGMLVQVVEAIPDAIDAIERNNSTEPQDRPQVLSTGLVDLDEMIGGLYPGQLGIVAGRPGTGKSVLGLGLATAAAKQDAPAAMFGLEQARRELLLRLLSAESRVPLKKLREGGMDELDWKRLAKRTDELHDLKLWISEETNLTVNDIRAECVRMQRNNGLGLVVVDYLQLLSAHTRKDNRQELVADMSRRLKLLAGELYVPVIALCQLNRGPEQRQDKRPVPADLRESGSLEQDADLILLLHRDDMYEPESERAGEVDIIVGKSRDTTKGTVTCAAQLHISRIVSMAVGL